MEDFLQAKRQLEKELSMMLSGEDQQFEVITFPVLQPPNPPMPLAVPPTEPSKTERLIADKIVEDHIAAFGDVARSERLKSVIAHALALWVRQDDARNAKVGKEGRSGAV